MRQLQRQLALAGDHPGPLDGRFGPLTEAAVIRFQAARGLPVDGIAGPLTAGALRAGRLALAPGAGYRVVSGSSAVRVLQRRLTSRGFDPGPIDGRYGPLTMRAVARFQRAHRLTMTGIAGVHTRAVLIGLTQQRHPTNSPVSAPVVLHPSRERQQLPLVPAAPAAGAAGTSVNLPALPITPVLLGFAALGLLAVTVNYTRTRRRVRQLAGTGSRALSRRPGVRAISDDLRGRDREPPPLPLVELPRTSGKLQQRDRDREPPPLPLVELPRTSGKLQREPHGADIKRSARSQINPGGQW